MEPEQMVGTPKGTISESEARRIVKHLDQFSNIIEALNTVNNEEIMKKVFLIREDMKRIKDMF